MSTHSVLVADDDGPIRRMLERTLSREGFSVTSVGGNAGNFLTVYPCDQPLPVASNLNTTNNETRANLVIAASSATGESCVYARRATDVVVDLFGLLRATATA